MHQGLTSHLLSNLSRTVIVLPLGFRCVVFVWLYVGVRLQLALLWLLHLLLHLQELVDLPVLVLANATVTPSRLRITEILLLMRIALHNPFDGPSGLPGLHGEVGLQDIPGHLVIIRYLELVDPIVLNKTQKRALDRKYVGYPQFMIKSPSRRILIPPSKPTILVVKSHVPLANQRRQQSIAGYLHRVVIPVEEAPQLLRMRVKVQHQSSLLLGLQNGLFELIDGGSHTLVRFLPNPVGIDARHLRSGIPMDNPIRIDHRNNLEHKVIIIGVTLPMSLHHQLQQITNRPLHHITRGGLNRMLPAQDPDHLTIPDMLLAGPYSDDIHRILPRSFTQFFNRQTRLINFPFQQRIHVMQQLRVRIRIRRCKVDRVIGLPKLVLKGQSIVLLILMIPPDIVLLIDHLNASPMPAHPLALQLVRIHQWLQPITEKRLLLDQIDDIEPHLLVLFSIVHLKVKPLIMTLSINIILQDQVKGIDAIRPIIILENVQQIPTLKMRIKDSTTRVYNWSLVALAFYRWQISIFLIGLQYHPIYIHKQTSKVVFSWLSIKSVEINLSLPVGLPQCHLLIIFILAIPVPDLLLDLVMLKARVLNRKQPIDLRLTLRHLQLGHHTPVGAGQRISIEASR